MWLGYNSIEIEIQSKSLCEHCVFCSRIYSIYPYYSSLSIFLLPGENLCRVTLFERTPVYRLVVILTGLDCDNGPGVLIV